MMTTFTAPTQSLDGYANATTQRVSNTKQGPSADDWERLRPIIKTLYIEEDRTLNDVKNIMADEYGHNATVKMYKLRFTKWEFDKHNRQSDMVFVARKKRARDAQRKKSIFIVRSKEISAQEVDRYVKRRRTLDPAFEETPADKATPLHILCLTPPDSPNPARAQDTSIVVAEHNTVPGCYAATLIKWGMRKRTRSPSPTSHNGLAIQRDYCRFRAWAQSPSVPGLVTVPDVLRIPEMLFEDIQSYIKCSINRGTWFFARNGKLKNLHRTTVNPSYLYDLGNQAIAYFDASSGVQGRRMLSKAFSLLPALLREEHPRLLENVMDLLLLVRQSGFVEICAIMREHIAELAKTILPEQHILRRICISLSHSEPDHAELLTRCWSCLIDTLALAFGRLSWNSVMNETDLVCRLYSSADPQRAEKLLRELLAIYEQTTQKLDDTALYLVDNLTDSIYRQGRHADVELLVEDAMCRAREAGCLSAHREASFRESLAWAQYRLSKDHLAEESILHAIALYNKECRVNDPDVIGNYHDLESWLREWGRDAEADLLLAQIDEMIGPDDIEIDLALMTITGDGEF